MRISVSQDQWRRAILLFLPLAFAIAVATYSWRVNVQLVSDYAHVTRAYAITGGAAALMSRTTDGETGERGFVITGNETYLQPYVLFTSTIADLYSRLAALGADDPILTPQIDLIHKITRKPRCLAALSPLAWVSRLPCRQLAMTAQALFSVRIDRCIWQKAPVAGK
jgi:CHASE3 domain sensor protein